MPLQSHCHVFPPAHWPHHAVICSLSNWQVHWLTPQAGRDTATAVQGPLGWGDDLLRTGLHSLVSLPLNRVSCLLWAGDQGRAWAGMVSSTLSDTPCFFACLHLGLEPTVMICGTPGPLPLLRSASVGAAVAVNARCHLAGRSHPDCFHFCFCIFNALFSKGLFVQSLKCPTLRHCGLQLTRLPSPSN